MLVVYRDTPHQAIVVTQTVPNDVPQETSQASQPEIVPRHCLDLLYRPQIADLPADWAELPTPASTQEFGRRWIASARGLRIFVPSAVIPEAGNALINPRHPAYRDIRLAIVREFAFDARVVKAP